MLGTPALAREIWVRDLSSHTLMQSEVLNSLCPESSRLHARAMSLSQNRMKSESVAASPTGAHRSQFLTMRRSTPIAAAAAENMVCGSSNFPPVRNPFTTIVPCKDGLDINVPSYQQYLSWMTMEMSEIRLNPTGNSDWFDGLSSKGVRPGLANITELMRRLDNPQLGMRTIHVAGTDGKGSVCAMIDSVLRASGYRTGLFTSPEILRINECIRVAGEEVMDEDLDNAISMVRPHVEDMAAIGMECTRFEVLTAMALVLFRILSVDIAVVEVGMGGRLDCTNVVEPEVTVINNISLEHTRYLGDTIEEIAYEKAGIMKEDVPCVTINEGPALDVLVSYAEKVGAHITQVSASEVEIIASNPDSVDMLYRGDMITVGLPGRFQAGNAVLAIAALSLIDGYPDTIAGNVPKGLSEVAWPCRMQKLMGEPIIVDVTHTFSGAGRLSDDISEIYGEVLTVIGMLEDKDVEGVCSELSRVTTKAIATAPASDRAADPSRIAAAMSANGIEVVIVPDVSSALDAAMECRGDTNILVTGSFRMAEEALKWLQRKYARSWTSFPPNTTRAATPAGTPRD